MTTRNEEGGVEPQTVDQARDAVERSRERIARTLDRLEDRIVEKKHELQDRADVFRPVKNQVRQRPLTAVALAVGIGALLGSLGGGDDEETDNTRRGKGHTLSDDELRELRAWRRERRERLRAISDHGERYRRGRRRGRGDPRLDSLKAQLIGAATTAIAAAITSRVKELARGSDRERGSSSETGAERES